MLLISFKLESTVDRLKKELVSAKTATGSHEVSVKLQLDKCKAEHVAKFDAVRSYLKLTCDFIVLILKSQIIML